MCICAVFVIVAGQSTAVDDFDGDTTGLSLYSVVAQMIRDFATLQVELAKSLAKIAKLEETSDHNRKYTSLRQFDHNVAYSWFAVGTG